MEASDNTSRRGLCGIVDAECCTWNTIPRGKVAPASEKVERTVRFIVFTGFLFLFHIVAMCRVDVLVNLWRCDELCCASLQRKRGRSCNEAGLCASGSTTWIANAAGKVSSVQLT